MQCVSVCAFVCTLYNVYIKIIWAPNTMHGDEAPHTMHGDEAPHTMHGDEAPHLVFPTFPCGLGAIMHPAPAPRRVVRGICTVSEALFYTIGSIIASWVFLHTKGHMG